jgi:hypothetical protein
MEKDGADVSVLDAHWDEIADSFTGLDPPRVSPPRLKKVKDFVWRRRKDDYVKLPQTAEGDYSHKE